MGQTPTAPGADQSVTATYPGFLQSVQRTFESRELGVYWLRCVGKLEVATIT